MKKIVFVLIVLTSCCKGQVGFMGKPAVPFPIPLILISGESNAGGFALNSDLTFHEASVRTTKILNNTTLLFENLLIGTNNLIGHVGIPDNATHGLENGIANCVDGGVLGNPPVYIMKSGFGAARIRYYNDSTDISYMGSNPWQILKPRLDSAIKIMNALNGQKTKVYLVWTQGINDSGDGLDPQVWKDSTKSFFAKFRLRYGQVPIFMIKFMAPFNNYDSYLDAICSELPECYSVSVADASLLNNKHWDYGGFKLIATRVLAAIKAHYTYY